MSYASLTDLRNKLDEDTLIQLTDDADTGAIDTAVIDAALEEADAEINKYLGKQYAVPLATVPTMVRYMAADIAIVNLYGRKQGAPDHRQDKYEKHLAFLEKVAVGEEELGVDTPMRSDSVQISSSERIFSREKLKGF